jgi:hypothetical protein
MRYRFGAGRIAGDNRSHVQPCRGRFFACFCVIAGSERSRGHATLPSALKLTVGVQVERAIWVDLLRPGL